MKKGFFTLLAGVMMSAQMMAVTAKDVCGKFDGQLWIDWDEYPSRSVYLLPGATDNTLTFVLPDFMFGAGKLGNIVLPNITMDESGKLTLEETSLYLDSIKLRATIKMLNNYEDEGETYNSLVSATEAQVTLEIKAPTLPLPIIVVFEGTAARENNYQLPNGGFEGAWTNNEPEGWHSFGSATGDFASFVINNTMQFQQAAEVRPGSKGAQSAVLSTKTVLGVSANGNCTNGRINAGSTDATDATGNYSFSDPTNEGFNTPFNGRPDSLVFWAKYVPADKNPANEVNRASLNAVITTNARYQDPEVGTVDYSAVKIGQASVKYAATADMGWQRLAVPFAYTELTDDPAYILATFSTNAVPGGGTATKQSADSVFIDDVELVYNKQLSSFTVNGEPMVFANRVATIEGNYCDSCAQYGAEANGQSAQTFIGFDAVHKCIQVYVVADDYAQTGDYRLYRVEFANSQAGDLNPLNQAVDEVLSEQVQSTKVLRNGRLYIRRQDGVLFDLTGRKVN